MISVQNAERLLAEQTLSLPSHRIPLEQAQGAVLRETIVADRDLPPFDRATMDGIAIAYEAWASGRRSFTVESVAAAGHAVEPLRDPGEGCARIMTGAMMPDGANCVVPIERVSLEKERAGISDDAEPAPGQFVHGQASDAPAGTPLLEEGIHLNATHIALAASVGLAEITVAKPPSVAVVSSGDELVGLGEAVEDFQIRPSNAAGIRAALYARGCTQVDLFHFRDDLDEMNRGLGDVFDRYELLILSGGVSMGDYDLVPRALEQLGARRVFHKVRQTPGKPMWFGVGPGDQPVFGLPGNPLSTLTCLHRYVLPFLERSLAAVAPPTRYAVLAKPVSFERPLTFFCPVRIRGDETGKTVAEPVQYNTSGDFITVGRTDGFLECPEDRAQFEKGDALRFWPWEC